MRSALAWLTIFLLPFFASCSSTSGILKRSDGLASPSTEKIGPGKAAPEEPSDEEGAFHIVGPGETLRHICHVYGLDLEKVAGVNKLRPPYALKQGDTIFLPAAALLNGNEQSADVRSASWKEPAERSGKSASVAHVAKAIQGKKHPLVPYLRFPVQAGVLTSPFGHRWGVFHKGLDIAAPVGSPVLACADGEVVFAGKRKGFEGYGNIVLLRHNREVYTTYAHLSRIGVKKGQKVRRGKIIAAVGNTGRSTGPHLHLEVRVRNQMFNPLAYFSPGELKGMMVAKRFTKSPMGPVPAQWKIPDLLAAGH